MLLHTSASALFIFFLFSSISVTFGDRAHQVREAVLKRKVYEGARKVCGYNNRNLLNGVKEVLAHVSEVEKAEYEPQSQYLAAVTEAYCSIRDYEKAKTIAVSGNFDDGALVNSQPIEADPSSVEDSDNFSNYSNDQVETKSYSARDIFVFGFGAVLGLLVGHYIFLLRSSPSNGTTGATKSLRRPEL